MRKQPYEPSFLISAKVPEELHSQLTEYAKSHGLSEEEACRQALKFFVAQCVHTQGGQKRRRRKPAR